MFTVTKLLYLQILNITTYITGTIIVSTHSMLNLYLYWKQPMTDSLGKCDKFSLQ